MKETQTSPFPLKIKEETTKTPPIQEKLTIKGELVLRTYIGKHIPDFVVAETELFMPGPAEIMAEYTRPLGGVCVARFFFFEFEGVMVDGGQVIHTKDRKEWIFTCSTGLLDQNYDKIKAILDEALEREELKS